jgi:RecA-family ATPase
VSEFKFLSSAEYLAQPQNAVAWLVEPLLSPGALLNIYGAPKAGKSRLALGLAIALSTGEPYWLEKFKLHEHGRILWLEMDNSPAEWVQVVKDAESEGWDLSNIHFADKNLAPWPMDMLNEEERHDLILREMVDRFLDVYGEMPILIVIDTIREIHSGDEDKSTIMRNVITRLQAAVHPIAILLVSHSRKGAGISSNRGESLGGDEDGGDGRVMDENRGSNYLTGKMQSVIRVTTNRTRTHGWFTAEGRSIGQERFKMVQKAPSYLWHATSDPVAECIQEVQKLHPEWSGRQVAADVAAQLSINPDAVRSALRRLESKRK